MSMNYSKKFRIKCFIHKGKVLTKESIKSNKQGFIKLQIKTIRHKQLLFVIITSKWGDTKIVWCNITVQGIFGN